MTYINSTNELPYFPHTKKNINKQKTRNGKLYNLELLKEFSVTKISIISC